MQPDDFHRRARFRIAEMLRFAFQKCRCGVPVFFLRALLYRCRRAHLRHQFFWEKCWHGFGKRGLEASHASRRCRQSLRHAKSARSVRGCARPCCWCAQCAKVHVKRRALPAVTVGGACSESAALARYRCKSAAQQAVWPWRCAAKGGRGCWDDDLVGQALCCLLGNGGGSKAVDRHLEFLSSSLPFCSQ